MINFHLILCVKSNNKAIQPESRCPELLANYCDFLLRRNQTKKLTEEEIKEKLNNVVRICLRIKKI
jgi:cullin-5